MTRQFRRLLALAVAIAALPAWAAAQGPATVTGKVTSEGGLPVAAASVFIEGQGVGAQTREDGTYTFLVPAAKVQGQQVTVSVRRIGFKPASKTITLTSGIITADFQLTAAAVKLSTIVVTGAGTVSTEEKLGNTINTVKGSEIARSNETNVVEALAGKAPGVEIQSQSGDPGASSFIRIRGASTIQGSGQPLFIVDGTPIDNSTEATGSYVASTAATNRAADIDPNDIASIEVLKGAAAAAIYGARAAQGVVIITTKKGRPGPTRYSFRSSISADQVSHGPALQTLFGQGFDGIPSVCDGQGCRTSPYTWGPRLTKTDYINSLVRSPDAASGDPGCDVSCATLLYNSRFPNGIQTYDHFGELFRTGTTFDNQLSISGGDDKTDFYLSLGRTNQNGIIDGPNNWYDKTSVHLKGSHAVTDRLRVGGNVTYVDARGEFTEKGSNVAGLMLGALRTSPDFNNREWIDPATGLHRSYRYPEPTPTSIDLSRGYDNPFFTMNMNGSSSTVGHTFGSFNADWQATNWLRVQENLGADYSSDDRLEKLAKSNSSYPTGMVTQANFTHYQIDHNLTATAEHTFTPDFAGTLTLGQNLNSRSFDQQYATGYDMLAPDPFSLNNTITVIPGEYQELIHTESYFGQATADLWNQLYLTAALRNDGFSTFGKSNPRHYFPKASLAWTFTNEFTGLQRYLDYGKFRIAYGAAGREPLPYQTMGGYYTGQLYDDGWGGFLNPYQNGNGGYLTSAVKGQDNLKPEITRELETGFDLGLAGGKADAGITFYDRKSSDVIFLAPLAPSTGYTAQAQNAATIRNIGWELTLNLHPIQKQNLAWDLGFNWSTNDNRVLSLSGAQYVGMPGSFTSPSAVAQVGSSVGVLRGFDYARCGVSNDVEVDMPDGSTSTVGALCGSAKKGALFIGPDGFPILDPTERVIMNPNPRWLGSVNTSLTINKLLTLSGLLDVKMGGQVWNGTRAMLDAYGTGADTKIRGQQRTFGKDYMKGAVAGPGAGTAVTLDENWFTDLGGGFGQVQTPFIEDGSYAKLRELSLTYSLTQPWVATHLGFSSIDLRLAGRNLFTWTPYTGVDPETNLGGAEVQLRGIDYFNNPQTRSVVFSIGLNR